MASFWPFQRRCMGKRCQKPEVIDSTVQEKNITYPVDTKQYRKIITRCWKCLSKKE